MLRMNKDRLTALLVISPSILLLAVFIYGFIGQTIYTSLTDWGTNPNKPPLAANVQIDYVGLKNYQDLFTGLLNNRFRLDLVNTVFFTALFLTACLGLGLLLAILLDQKVKGESIFRTIFLFPMALSFVVTGTVWRWLFQPNSGINVLPTMFGGQPLTFQWFIDTSKILPFTWRDVLLIVGSLSFLIMAWFAASKNRRRLSNLYIFVALGLIGALFFVGAANVPASVAREAHGLNTAIIAIVIAAVWQMSGYTMAIYLAGLRGIPEELREAARVDGCTELQVYRYVVLPLLKPITLSAAIILGHISLKIFDLVYVMAGGSNRQVDVPGINMYITAFFSNNFALGSSIAVIMLIMVAVIIIPYLFNALRRDEA
ncbi:MAG: sugar ABC transporter permease [Anaerolineae bacterium]|nr:sugar ABC transporter permease [Anaerolineae bacterium]